MTRPHLRVCVVLFDGFELLDVFGPVQLFKGAPEFEVVLAAAQATAVPSSHGVEVVAQLGYDQISRHDILLIPGGLGTRRLVGDGAFLDRLAAWGARAPVVSSVCTGSAVLAAAGLLDGYRATSNKRAFAWASTFGCSVAWCPEARWVHDRDRWTSAGVAAGMDMTAALIADLVGENQAVEAAHRAEYEPHRDSTWDPFARLNGLV